MSGIGDPYRKVRPGEPVKIPARAWNELVGGLRPGANRGGEPVDGMSAPYSWVYAKNTATGPVSRWSVVAITGLEVTPTGTTGPAAQQFESMPIVTASSPTAGTTAWGVAIEPIEAGKLGRLAVAGVVQVKASDLGKAGGYQLLYRDATWALVAIGGGLRLGTIAATWTKGQTATVTEQFGDGTQKPGSPAPTFTATNYFATITVSSGTRRVACGKVDDRWILVAAEC